MTEQITINTHNYDMSARGDTSSTRKGVVSGKTYSAIVSHQQAKQNGIPVVRSMRKIQVPEVLADGTTVVAEATIVTSLPVRASSTPLTAAMTELLSWAGQAGFVTEILTEQV